MRPISLKALPHWRMVVAALVVVTSACAPRKFNDKSAKNEVRSGVSTQENKLHSLNLDAGKMVLYEVQVRAANACDPNVGDAAQREACSLKAAPKQVYRAENMTCGIIEDLHRIKLGTFEDMTANTADYRKGITLRYIKERVGANTVWLMPMFPNNDTWSIPDACDNTGSPYAVRDYLHVQGSLSRECIKANRDEFSDTPCWGTASFENLIEEAHSKGLRVILDLAFNHFGHNYQMYDYQEFTPTRERLARGENLDTLWKFTETFEASLLNPVILDTVKKLEDLATENLSVGTALADIRQRCPAAQGQELVRLVNSWRDALDWERASFACLPVFLENTNPGFYLGRNAYDPSTKIGDNFTNNWRDVKFLFHHEENKAHSHEFYRQREYLFRIMNYWASKGVDGFRLDHTTDPQGGMTPNEWKYIISKTDHYALKRNNKRLVYLAEEFGDQMGMSHTVDIMTEGYVFDMTARNGATKNAGFVEKILQNMERFAGRTYVMSALETHDEHRLTDHTGFNFWTGAGFWGIGATTWSTPMILMGQEFGEKWGLGFRRADYLRSRFVGSQNYVENGDDLVAFYRGMITGRLDDFNRALTSANYHFLRTRESNKSDDRIFAMVKWTDDNNVVFVFHNLWEQNVKQSYFIPPEIGSRIALSDDSNYRLVDVISKDVKGACRKGKDLKWDFPVEMNSGTRLQWLRLEKCN